MPVGTRATGGATSAELLTPSRNVPTGTTAWSESAANSVKQRRGMIQKMPEGVDSKFRLVLLVARRAEQLMRGARPKLETDRPRCACPRSL